MKITKSTLYAFYAVMAIAIISLLGLTFYNYSKSGKFNFSSITITAMLLLVSGLAVKSVRIEE